MSGELLILLVAGHYLADYGLQTQYVAANKGRSFVAPDGVHCLTAHAMIHGLVTAAVFGAIDRDWVIPFFVVATTHWVIDFGKSWEGWAGMRWRANTRADRSPPSQGLYGIHVDQALHGVVILLVTLWAQ